MVNKFPKLRVQEYNGPETHKKGLVLPVSKRPKRYFRMANRRWVTVSGGQEWGNALRAETRRRKHWRLVLATPNSREWGNIQACGVLLKKKQCHVLDLDEFSVRGLHGPAVLLEHNRTGYRWVHMSAHVPTTRHKGGSSLREAYNTELIQFIRELGDVPWILSADSNSGAGWVDQFKPLGGRVVARQGVCVIVASNHFRKRRSYTVNMPKISDHRIVGAVVQPTRLGDQITKFK